MTERRFNEAEVAAIFERAANTPRTSQHQIPSGEGMTLAELQQIGAEVGITPGAISDAAHVIGQSGRPMSRRFLGFPLGVGRTIDLGRKLSDDEWERLVVDLRETFDARGSVKSEGSLRQWTNGNLQALLEPTTTGHRLRLRTMKRDSRNSMVLGLVLLGVSSAILVAVGLTGAVVVPGAVSEMGVLAAIGAGLFALGALRLPRWARLRERQMEEIAGRLVLVPKSEPSGGA